MITDIEKLEIATLCLTAQYITYHADYCHQQARLDKVIPLIIAANTRATRR